MSDTLLRFDFAQSPIRGEICQLHALCHAVTDRHDYPLPVRTLLGEAMSAVVLMAAMLKLEGSLILQIEGDGPVNLVMAECNHRGEVRAMASHGDDPVPDEGWLAMVGQGRLLLTIDPEDGQRYQGIVPLEGASLAEALGHYFAQSEQLPTEFHLFADGERAGGLMLQVLPGHDQGDDTDLWPRVRNLAATLSASEMLSLDAESVLYRLFHEETVQLLAEQALAFVCSCSRARSENALRAIAEDELKQLLDEQGGLIEVRCQFCLQRYPFDRIDIEQMLRQDGSPGSDSLQ